MVVDVKVTVTQRSSNKNERIIIMAAQYFKYGYLNMKQNFRYLTEDPSFSTGGRLIFKYKKLYILVSDNLM